MRWTTLIGIAVALVTATVAYGAIRATRPVLLRVREAPLVSAAGRHGRAGWEWLTVRVTTQVLVLAAGSAIVLMLASVFVEILDGVVDQDDLTVVDRPVVQWLAEHRMPGLTSAQVGITDLGGIIMLSILLTLTATLVSIRTRRWQPFLLTFVTIGGIQLLVYTIKLLIARDRPNPAGQIVAVGGFSFPSGHSASSLVGFAMIAWLICSVTSRRTVWATAWLTAPLLAVAVGTSRVYLGVHYPSDVLGGWVLGATWLATVAVAVRIWPTRPAATDPATPDTQAVAAPASESEPAVAVPGGEGEPAVAVPGGEGEPAVAVPGGEGGEAVASADVGGEEAAAFDGEAALGGVRCGMVLRVDGEGRGVR